MRPIAPLILATLFAVTSACSLAETQSSGGASSCTGEIPEHTKDEAVGWRCISAESGGRVDIPDGGWLEVPPGALDHDQRITVKVPSPRPAYSMVYKLEPSGLTFKKPVTIHSPLPSLPSGKPMPVTVIHASDLHPMVSAGNERTHWQYVTDTKLEPETKTMAASISHFSSVYYFYQVDEYGYLVVDLPIRYLQAGDIVTTLTNRDETEGPDWNPGHIGMVHEIAPSGDVGVVIESTPPDGVGKSGLSAFKTDYGHLYMGARRPGGPPLTPAERATILDFTQQQNGKGYNVVGQGNYKLDAFSCVGLVEAALDVAGRGTIPWNGEFFAITPLEMFRATRPITDVRERVGKAVEIPVYGVTLDVRSPYVGTTMRGFYQRHYDYEIAASSKPEGSTFQGSPDSGYTFSWTPTVDDGCVATGPNQPCPSDGNPHLVVLEMNATPRVTIVDGAKVALDPVHITETLTVHVTAHSREFPIEPQPPGASHEFTVTIPLPMDAKYESSSLRDQATKGAVSGAPLPGHTATIVSEGYDKAANAARVTIRVSNVTNETISAAPVKWLYTLDYSRNRVLGPG